MTFRPMATVMINLFLQSQPGQCSMIGADSDAFAPITRLSTYNLIRKRVPVEWGSRGGEIV